MFIAENNTFQELKFVQAEIKSFTTLAVVTRYRRDFLQAPKRGGKITSNVDSRVTFTVQQGTFRKTEHFVLQVRAIPTPYGYPPRRNQHSSLTSIHAIPKRAQVREWP